LHILKEEDTKTWLIETKEIFRANDVSIFGFINWVENVNWPP